MAWKMIGNSTFGVNKQQVVIKLSFWLVQNLSLTSFKNPDASGRQAGMTVVR